MTVSFACSDEGAGLAGEAPSPAVVSAEGADQLRSADCADRVGHVTTASSGPISIDKSPPSGLLTCPSPVTLNEPASAAWTALDALSGLAGEAEGAVALDTTRAGTFTARREVTDNVGHRATLSCEYRVEEAPAQPPAATPTPTVTPTPTATPAVTPAAGPAPAATGSSSSPALTPAPPWPEPFPAAAAPAARPASLQVKPRPVRRGRLRLSLACSGAHCAGRLTAPGRRSRELHLPAGERTTILLPLTRGERRELARRRRLALRVTVRLAGAPTADVRRLTVRSR